MNKRTNAILTVAAVAAVGSVLLGSAYTQAPGGVQAADVAEGADLYDQIREMGGIKFVLPEAFAEGDCDTLETSGRNVVDFELDGYRAQLPYLGHTPDEPKTYYAMTFDGQVPGPTLRVTQGDVVRMTLTIPADEATAHGNDMHASQISGEHFGAVQPGESATYCYIAHSAGVFKYHCSGIDLIAMDEHVLSGMYGIAIVDPADGYKPLMVEKTTASGEVERKFYPPEALEFQLQYNQLYLTDAGTYDQPAMMQHRNSHTVVNGISFGYLPNEAHNELVTGDANTNIVKVIQPWNSADLAQYQSQLLFVENDQHVRVFVENQGNEPVYWHVVGEIIDRITQGNRIQSAATETWLLGGSQNMIADIVFDQPGTYVAVNHDYAAIFSGAATVFVAGDPFGLNDKLEVDPPVASYAYLLGNPSDAIPPYGEQSIEHPKQNLHGLYTDERAAEIKRELGI